MPRVKNYQSEKRWILKGDKILFSLDKISELIARILSNRGIKTEEEALNFLNPDYGRLADPYELLDMDRAVRVILEAIESNKKITIYGDYDVDGISATALLVTFFAEIGVNVTYYIPSRQDEGYGLNNEAIDRIVAENTDLLITVDCGSSSLAEIDYATERGLRVVVTDHHNMKMQDGEDLLPRAEAVINPKRINSKLKEELAGVGVAFYLVRALQKKMLETYPKGREKWLLDFVALGTICDVVPLTGENRILAKFGLTVLSKTKRAGFKALAKVSGVDLGLVSAYHVGFLLGPRLNAAGRLEDAITSLQLILEKDIATAEKLASKLDAINQERQELTERIVNEAREMIRGKEDQKIFLLKAETWPSGVVGIVASRLVEEFGKPFLVMEEDKGILKGSARSISCFNIIDALAECKEYLITYGGHAFAAGFKLDLQNFDILNKGLQKIAKSKINDEDIKPLIKIDGEVLNNKIEQKLITDINLLEPYGSGNPRPIFMMKQVEVVDYRLVGNPAIHLKMTVKKGDQLISGMAFNWGEEAMIKNGDLIDLACLLEENNWKNRSSIEFRVVDVVLNK